MVNPRKKGKFQRPVSHTYKRLKKSWRKHKGSQSKTRRGEKGKVHMPRVGYGAPKKLRGLHPSGLKEIIVNNANDLQKIVAKTQAVRIAAKVGKRKRSTIIEEAKKLKIKVLNP